MAPRSTPARKKPLPPDLAEVGAPGLLQWSGLVYEEFHPNLQGARARRIYKEMADNDAVVGAILFAVNMLIRRVTWSVEVDKDRLEMARDSENSRAKALGINPKDMAAMATTARRQQAMVRGPSGWPGATNVAPPSAGMGQVTTIPAVSAGLVEAQPVSKAAGINPVDMAAMQAALGRQPRNGQTNGRAQANGNGQPSLPPPIIPRGVQKPDPLEAQAEHYAEWIDSCRHDMQDSWNETMTQIITMLQYGWSYFEVVSKLRKGPDQEDPTLCSEYSDGLVGWRKFGMRAQDSFWKWEIVPETGEILGMWQRTPPRYEAVFIPIERALLFRTTTNKNNPEGRSILRNAYRAFYYKKIIEEIEGIGVERDLAGLPVAWVPPSMLSPNATPQELAILNTIKTIVRNVKRDEQEGLVFPLDYDDKGHKLYDFTLMASGGRRHFDLDQTIARWDQRIAMACLADFILLGHENVGSFALGTAKIDLFVTALEAWVEIIAAVINHQAIPKLMRVNGFPPALAPKLKWSDLARVDLTELSQYVTALANAGMPLFPDEKLEVHLRDQAGLPPPGAEVHAAVEQKQQQSKMMSEMQQEGLAQAQVKRQGGGKGVAASRKTAVGPSTGQANLTAEKTPTGTSALSGQGIATSKARRRAKSVAQVARESART